MVTFEVDIVMIVGVGNEAMSSNEYNDVTSINQRTN